MFRKIIRGLKQFSKKIAYIQTVIILNFVYIAIVPLFILLFYIFKYKTDKKTTWSIWKVHSDTLSDLRRQY